MVAKIKQWFKAFWKSVEEAGMERARRHIQQYGYRRWE
jgi:hypothetical protein